MAGAFPSSLWERLAAVVKAERYLSANDEFADFRDAVQAATSSVLQDEADNADLAWEFLVGFAAKKMHYRAHVVKVVRTLYNAPGLWRQTLERNQTLRVRIVELHPDLQAAFGVNGNSFEKTATGSVAPSDVAASSVESSAQPASMVPAEVLSASAEVPMTAVVVEAPLDAATSSLQTFLQPASTLPAAVVSASAEVPITAAGVQGRESPGPVLQRAMGAVQQVTPFLQRSKELSEVEPVVAHYCRIYVIELLIAARQQGESSPESDALLISTLEEAEAIKPRLDLSDGRRRVEDFVARVYSNAVEADQALTRAGVTSSSAVQQLYLASIFLEVLAQFHGGLLPPDLRERSLYAKSRAMHLRDCLKRNLAPDEPAAPELIAAFTPTPGGAVSQDASLAAARAPVADTTSALGHRTSNLAARTEPAVVPASLAVAAPVLSAGGGDAVALARAAAVAAGIADGKASTAAITPVGVRIPPGTSAAKRRVEAKKRADLAAVALGHGDRARGKQLVQEALAWLEGL